MSLDLRRLPLVIALALLAGCAARPVAPPPVTTAPESPAQAQERRAQASRPTYNLAGYIDGCETA